MRVSLNFRYTSSRMRVNIMEDDSVFEEEGEERDSFVQPARGLRSFALVSCLFVAVFELGNSQSGISVTISCSVVLLWAKDPDTFRFMINTDPQPFIITCWNLYFVIPSIQDLNCLYATETETAHCYAWWRRVDTAFVCSLVLWIRIRIRRTRMHLGLPDPDPS